MRLSHQEAVSTCGSKRERSRPSMSLSPQESLRGSKLLPFVPSSSFASSSERFSQPPPRRHRGVNAIFRPTLFLDPRENRKIFFSSPLTARLNKSRDALGGAPNSSHGDIYLTCAASIPLRGSLSIVPNSHVLASAHLWVLTFSFHGSSLVWGESVWIFRVCRYMYVFSPLWDARYTDASHVSLPRNLNGFFDKFFKSNSLLSLCEIFN